MQHIHVHTPSGDQYQSSLAISGHSAPFSVFVPDHVTFLNQVTYSGNLVQTELPIEWKPNQITFG